MRTPVALAFALGLYWLGLQQGAAAPGSIVPAFLTVAAVLITAEILWQIGVRIRRSRRPA